jgi:hypothetical protein
MATTREFNDMLNEYLTNDLLMEELVKRDYFLQKIAKDEDWKGGDVIVPFRGAQASSVKFGSLTASNDIAQSKYVRGKIEDYREVWGSLIFNETDLQQHDGKITESTFLKILPDEIDTFMDYFKEVTSFQLAAGPHFATVTDATDAATGIMIVDRIDRFVLRMKVTLDDSNSDPADYYVIGVNVNTNAVTLSATRDGSAADVSAYSVAQAAKFYYDGVWDGTNSISFVSIKNALLSATNGGGTTLHGQTKTAYPYLQAVNISGSSISATNIVDELFDAYVDVRIKARGKASTFVMSYKNWASCMRSQQIEKGAYSVVGAPKKSEFGWQEMTIASTKNGETLDIAGVQEMPDDVIFVIDWNSMKFLSNGGFKKRVSPDGRMYHELRNTTGYQYIVDTCLFGELQHTKPGNNGIIHSISY